MNSGRFIPVIAEASLLSNMSAYFALKNATKDV